MTIFRKRGVHLMAITHKRQDDLESMFANFASFPKVSSDPEKKRKVRIKTIRKRLIKFYGHFYSLTSKCLTMVCLDNSISIIIEALPFVLLGTILSGFIEVYVGHLIWCDVTFLKKKFIPIPLANLRWVSFLIYFSFL